MRSIYLSLAVLGAVVPYAFFGQHFAANGFAVTDFVAAVFATRAASGFAADLLISSVVLWVFLYADGGGRWAWLIIPLNLLIGLSCALPAYLYLRSRAQPVAARGAG